MKNEMFWMVWNPEGRMPARRHDTKQSAVSEAERLARGNPGSEFFVMQATDMRVVDAMQRVELIESDEMPF